MAEHLPNDAEALPGGLAIYGQQFGRYPLDPTLVFMLNAEQAQP